MIGVVSVSLLDMLLKRYVVMSLYITGYFSVVLCVIVFFSFPPKLHFSSFPDRSLVLEG